MQNLGYTALLLGVLVTVHELGHFLLAKALGVKVLRFSIGFGPRIFGFTKGETEYRVAWIPLGGYVKMAGEQPYDELSPEDAKRGFLNQAPWKRALIVIAGPAFNLIFPVLVFFFVFFGQHTAVAPVVGAVEPGSPAASAQLQPGDRILAVDDEPVRTFEELQMALQPRYDKEIRLTLKRGDEQVLATLTPTRSTETNPIERVPRGMIGIRTARPPVIGVPAGSAAEVAGLKSFDRIVSINGEPVKSELSMIELLKKSDGQLTVQVARSTPVHVPGANLVSPGLATVKLNKTEGTSYQSLGGAETADLYVSGVRVGSEAEKQGMKRGDRLLTLKGQPIPSAFLFDRTLENLGEEPFSLTWRSGTEEKSAQLHQEKVEVFDPVGNRSQSLDIGFSHFIASAAENQAPETVTLYRGAGEALSQSVREVTGMVRQIAMVIPKLFTDKHARANTGGVLLLYDLAGKSAEHGMDTFLRLMAVISINLGVMNLLPIPILDGFHLLAALWEGVRRRPIPARAREVANMIGLALLVVLMVGVFYNDLTRH
ncbi:MAG: RIP metalloprotease RseP [Myxococcaceae bacterium]